MGVFVHENFGRVGTVMSLTDADETAVGVEENPAVALNSRAGRFHFDDFHMCTFLSQ